MDKYKVAIVGCGNIGADICIALQKGTIPAEIVALHDIDESKAQVLNRTFHLNAVICGLEEAVSLADFVIESAVSSAVEDVIRACIKYRRDCLIMSLSGLLNNLELIEEAKKNFVRIKIPSGAVCGLDGIRSAMEAGLHRVMLTTRKSPQALMGAPYLIKNNIDLSNITEPMTVFEGNALEAAQYFPANINVACALSLYGIGPKETKVRIVADPTITENIHEIYAEGAFGRLQTTTVNLPSPRNIKSSYLASLSAIAELRAMAEDYVVHCLYCPQRKEENT
ncbi:MAG TPA: aspartate dehydrogenase [Candidatus Hydrogenedens sp.]|nr:aspartate dehydrogenase [Candidatus Hydrogenedens sp.]HOK08614.1 aspartate dehydrogenase [Candidatus Hydrogenedens sp.]HOL19904.1 aspartate dehydrogenase [Candidatus Hydrogenedens sp.]HPP58345.1 aspartate dehydrogenase [Candidatus Hydrogenedens sp.]